MAGTDISAAEKEQMVGKIKTYFRDNLDQEIGGFDAEFLLDFFFREFGGYLYNRGLHDAHTIFSSKVEELADAVYALEKPTEL